MYIAPLFSGSSGNSLLVEAGGTRLLIDAGKPAKTIEEALSGFGLSPSDVSAILITHEHTDHIAGAGVLGRKYRIPIYANAATWQAMENAVGSLPPGCRREFETGRDFYIGEVNILPFSTPHDAAESVGYCFYAKGRKLTVMTDIGHMTENLYTAAAGSDLLLIEANHDPELVSSSRYPYPLKRRILSDRGHLSNENCGRALCRLYKSGVRGAILGHLSRENNFEQLALETVRAELDREQIPRGDFRLWVAHRDGVTGRFAVEDEE